MRAEFLLRAFSYLKYDAVNLGERDFSQGINFLSDCKTKYNSPLISANVFQPDGKTLVYPPFVIKELKNVQHGDNFIPSVRVGIFGVMMQRSQLNFEPNEPNFVVGDPIEAAKRVISQIKDRCDIIIGLVHIPYPQLTSFVKQVPGIDIVIAGHDPTMRFEPQEIDHTLIIVAGNRGQYIGDLRLVMNGQRQIIDYQGKVVSLDEKIKDDPEILKLINEYKEQETALTYEINREQYRTMKMYLGATACKKCHEEQYKQWQKTAHARAFDRLQKEGNVDDVQCAQCHTTGFAQYNGYYNLKETSDMIQVQCEACHGIGKLHVQSVEKIKSDKLKAAILAPITEETCISCHTSSRDPEFDYEKDLQKVQH